MKIERFADFVRFIDIVATRRASLGAVFAASLVNVLGRFGGEDAAARKRRRKNKKKKCKGGTKRCGKKCVDLSIDGSNCGVCGHACLSGACFHGACICASVDDCGECFCKKSVQGELVCGSAATDDPCQTDDDCPLGSFCLNSDFSTCTVACLT